MSLLSDKIEQLLTQYDQRKGFFRFFFRFFFRDPPAIRALKKLTLTDKNNIFKVYQCFSKNLPKEGDKAYFIYKELMSHIAKDQHYNQLVFLLNFLLRENLTTQISSNLLEVYNKHDVFFSSLKFLKNSQILTQKNVDDIANHQNTLILFLMLDQLSQVPRFGSLSQRLFDLLKLSPHFLFFYTLINSFRATDFINSQNLERLLQLPEDNFLVTNDAFRDIWARIPNHLLTQAVFDQLIRFSQQENSQQLLVQYVNQLLELNPLELEQPELNDQNDLPREISDQKIITINEAQSTHFTSVNRSVSDSARKLFDRYSLMIEGNRLQNTLQMIHDYIMQLPGSSIKNSAAKRCVERIIKLNFTDASSHVTIPQLLALSFLAVHDSGKRIGDLIDAREQFVEGLYEIQRGYNLSENGHDLYGPDKTICTSGTFNKLIEKLEGVHPDVQVLHITPTIASLKLPIVVREEALDYLSSVAKPQTLEGFRRFTRLIEQMRQDECVEIIWGHIKTKIVDRMFTEFGSLYKGKTDPQLLDMVEAGQCLKLDNLSRFQEQVLSSSEYKQYHSQTPYNFFSEPSATNSDISSPRSRDLSRRIGS